MLVLSLAAVAFVGRAFVSAPQPAPAPVQRAATAGSLASAAALAAPLAAHAQEASSGSIWIPALSAVGAGVGQGIASGRCIDGISRQPEVADDLRGVLLL